MAAILFNFGRLSMIFYLKIPNKRPQMIKIMKIIILLFSGMLGIPTFCHLEDKPSTHELRRLVHKQFVLLLFGRNH
jgi:hypothetical protein